MSLAALLRNVSQVALGQDHILILAQGEVWSCGSGFHGQLGLGNTNSSLRAAAIPELSKAKADICAVAAGERHSLALSLAGSVWAFGDNHVGQLGIEYGSLQAHPVLNASLGSARFVACGGNHSLVGLEDGFIVAFGCNEFGQLGIGQTDERRVCKPTRCSVGAGVERAAGGGHHSLFLDRDGGVYACGRGVSGQLGLGPEQRLESLWVPTRITHLDESCSSRRRGPIVDRAEQVSCGAHHSAVRTRFGFLYTFGSNL